MIKQLKVLAGRKSLTIKELSDWVDKLAKHEQSVVADLQRQKDNPSVRDMYNQTQGRLEVATAIQQAIRGNLVALKMLCN